MSYTPTSKHIFETSDSATPRFRAELGLSEDVIRKISASQHEPEWMLTLRLNALALLKENEMPSWGPDLTALDLQEICYFIDPDAQQSSSWDDVPSEIRSRFEQLGIPEAERESLAGVGAQFDSGTVYHNIKKDLEDKGVIFEDMGVAVTKYESLVREHFMTSCVSVRDHYFATLHAAVWSGGTFIYVPEGVHIDLPLQAYFRMNALQGGQFEHTLIIAEKESSLTYIEGCSAPRYAKNSLHAGCVEIFVKEKATVQYLSIENWSKNTYNLNTKRAIVQKEGRIEWISGNMGSGTTMLYPCSILQGEKSTAYNLGIAYAGADQLHDIGAKSVHIGKSTKSVIESKSICSDNGKTVYRGLIKITPNAEQSFATSSCDGILLSPLAAADAIPYVTDTTATSCISHEASVGTLNDEAIAYLESKGIKREKAMQSIVTGFIAPVIKKLPLEYAVELQRLIELEMTDAIL